MGTIPHGDGVLAHSGPSVDDGDTVIAVVRHPGLSTVGGGHHMGRVLAHRNGFGDSVGAGFKIDGKSTAAGCPDGSVGCGLDVVRS